MCERQSSMRYWRTSVAQNRTPPLPLIPSGREGIAIRCTWRKVCSFRCKGGEQKECVLWNCHQLTQSLCRGGVWGSLHIHTYIHQDCELGRQVCTLYVKYQLFKVHPTVLVRVKAHKELTPLNIHKRVFLAAWISPLFLWVSCLVEAVGIYTYECLREKHVYSGCSILKNSPRNSIKEKMGRVSSVAGSTKHNTLRKTYRQMHIKYAIVFGNSWLCFFHTVMYVHMTTLFGYVRTCMCVCTAAFACFHRKKRGERFHASWAINQFLPVMATNYVELFPHRLWYLWDQAF